MAIILVKVTEKIEGEKHQKDQTRIKAKHTYIKRNDTIFNPKP